ncbi:hypothetical protein B0T25DRAFT_8684 [Lasiosphaeria hispida]|uniref:Uncharacterized protein n=1 Tax=Lasiosphaeria hispida TaxID=260671 RepID=A0AAJ0HTF2_9PEZI|nr:hypothetical protein B0T25DRAFT_8684 [Lasiosphaeria hispida]
MSTTKDFEAAYVALRSPDDRSRLERMEELFPSFEDIKAFNTWLSTKREAHQKPVLTTEDFIMQIDSQALTQTSVIQGFVSSMMRDTPTAPIGSDRRHLYRLVADPYGLTSNDKNSSMETLDKSQPLIDHAILGLNSTVQPKEPAVPASRRAANLSEASTRSGESDDHHQAPGFIFFQLGSLQFTWHHLESDWSPAVAENLAATIDENSGEYQWVPTGFYLVARLGHFGCVDGIYAIYNMYPLNEDTGLCEQVTWSSWGIPPKRGDELEQQFSVARIGDTLGSLGYAKPIVWSEMIEHPVELVRVKPAENSLGAVRETVDKALFV